MTEGVLLNLTSGYGPSRVVHRRRHTYLSPDGVLHLFWTVGCAPPGEAMTGILTPISRAGKGNVLRALSSEAFKLYQQEFWTKMGWSLTDHILMDEMEERFTIVRTSWRSPPRVGAPSPRDTVKERFFSRLDWYACHDDGDAPGEPMRAAPFRFPASCLAEGLMTEMIFPDGHPNIRAGEGKDHLLTPYKGSNPAEVAKWWATYHLGFPRIKRERMRHRHGSRKGEYLPNTDPIDPDSHEGPTPEPFTNHDEIMSMRDQLRRDTADYLAVKANGGQDGE